MVYAYLAVADGFMYYWRTFAKSQTLCARPAPARRRFPCRRRFVGQRQTPSGISFQRQRPNDLRGGSDRRAASQGQDTAMRPRACLNRRKAAWQGNKREGAHSPRHIDKRLETHKVGDGYRSKVGDGTLTKLPQGEFRLRALAPLPRLQRQHLHIRHRVADSEGQPQAHGDDGAIAAQGHGHEAKSRGAAQPWQRREAAVGHRSGNGIRRQAGSRPRHERRVFRFRSVSRLGTLRAAPQHHLLCPDPAHGKAAQAQLAHAGNNPALAVALRPARGVWLPA